MPQNNTAASPQLLSKTLETLKEVEIYDKNLWWSPGKYDPYEKIRFLDPREIRAMWGYEMTSTIKEPEMTAEKKQKCEEAVSKWWEKVYINSLYGPITSLTVTNPGSGYKDIGALPGSAYQKEPKMNMLDDKTILKRVLAHKDTVVGELNSTSVFDMVGNYGSQEITCKIRFNGDNEDIWKERDEVCTERRIADLEKKNAELVKENARVRDERAKACQLGLAFEQKYNEFRKVTQEQKKKCLELEKLLTIDIPALKSELAAAKIEASCYKQQLDVAAKRLAEAGLMKHGQNVWGKQVESPMMSLPRPGQHADWRRIVEAKDESDQ